MDRTDDESKIGPVEPPAPATKGAAVKVDLGPLPGLVGYLLRRAQIATFQDFARTYAPFDIRPAQYAALTIIERNPGLKQKEVSDALGIKRTNFVAMCDAFEARGLAERRQASGDRRSYALHLTADGHALMQKLHAANAECEARIVEQVGVEEQRQLVEMLGIIAAQGEISADNGD